MRLILKVTHYSSERVINLRMPRVATHYWAGPRGGVGGPDGAFCFDNDATAPRRPTDVISCTAVHVSLRPSPPRSQLAQKECSNGEGGMSESAARSSSLPSFAA